MSDKPTFTVRWTDSGDTETYDNLVDAVNAVAMDPEHDAQIEEGLAPVLRWVADYHAFEPIL